MKTNSTAVRTKPKGVRVTRFMKKHKGSTKVIAFSLAFMMIFSVFSANISSIVRLLEAFADDSTEYYVDGSGNNRYYQADLTLYDYYTDSELKGGSDNNAYDGVNRNSIFNKALLESGYADKVYNGSSGTNRWPLYLGLQFPGQSQGNQMIKDSSNAYHYSIVANSEANSGTSGAAQGLVDSQLYGGDITQAGGKVVLPYFNEEFLTANLSSVLSSETISEEGLTGTNTLGTVATGKKFKFIKFKDGYYKYRSLNDRLGYAGDTFTVGTGGYQSDLSWPNHSSQNAFFPWATMGGAKTFGYGAKFEIPFTMSSDGQTIPRDSNGNYDANGTKKPIKFTFSGDDDVWVFIDDHLVLDVGGAHGAVSGVIDFTKDSAYAKTNFVKSSGYNQQDGNASVVEGPEDGVSMNTLFKDTLHLYDDITKEHTMTVYYIERGSLESNCEITFNFQIADTVTVANKLKTEGVNPFFESDLKSVTDSEAIEYVMSSDSATSGIDSPEKGVQEGVINSQTLYTLSFDKNSPEATGGIASKTVASGAQVVLPAGYRLNRSGYRLKGWSTTSDGSVNTSSPYTVNSTQTLYAIWEKIPPAPMVKPNEPTLVFLNSNYYVTWKDIGTTVKSVVDDYKYLGNMTSSDLSKKPYEAVLQTKDNNNDNIQHPRDDNPFTNNAGTDYVDKIYNGDKLEFRKNGGFYIWTVEEHSSTVDRYSNYAAYNATLNPPALDTWISDYYATYNTLLNTYNTYKDTTNTAIRNAYSAALKKYYSLNYGGTMTDEMNALNTAISNYNDNYTTKYYYSTTETVTFYVYSSSAPTVLSANNYGDANYTDGNTDTKSYTATLLASVPSGHQEPGGSSGSYYEVTVPKYVMSQEYTKSPDAPTSADPEECDNNITITADGNTFTMKADDLEDISTDNYPCWYAADDITKGITDAVPSYTASNPKIIWVYSTSGTPTVTYTNPFSGNSTTVTVTHDSGDPDNYYYAEVYTTITDNNASTSQETAISINGGTATASSTITSKGDAPCYFITSSNGGWYNLVTLMVDKVSWWPECRLYIQQSAAHPLHGDTWPTTSVFLKATGSGNYYYTFTPALSGVDVVFTTKDNNSPYDYPPSWASSTNGAWRTIENYKPTISSDTRLSNYTQDSNHFYYYRDTNSIPSSDATYYSYTATSKSASRLSGAASQPTRSLSPLAVIPDPELIDPETTEPETTEPETTEPETTEPETTEPETTEPETTEPEATEPETTEPETDGPASGSASADGQFVGSNNGNGGDFTQVGGTGFKLYDPDFKTNTNGAQEYVVRRSDSTGHYNLMFGQSAKFSYQFARGSHLKIAETGDSFAFSSAQKNAGTTTTDGTTIISDVNDVPLYKRYKTTFEIKDGTKATSDNGGNNERYRVGNQTLAAATSNNLDGNSLKIANLDNSSPADEGVQLEVTYTNEVRTGSLTFSKALTNDLFNQLKSAYENNNIDTEFYFQVKFKNVFKGATTEKVYTGEYFDSADNSITSYTSKSSNNTTYNNIFVIKFSDLYDVNDNYASKNYYFKIKGIPVYTTFTIEEIIPQDADYTVSAVNGSYDSGEGALTTSGSSASGLIPVEVEGNTKDTVYGAANDAQYTPDTDVDSAQYFAASSAAIGNEAEFTNDRNVPENYLIIRKTIDHLYYNTENAANGNGDNPAGLLDKNVTVGGASSTSDDHNGYQAATEAEQTFIFRIDEYDNPSGSVSRTFYETISFATGDNLQKERLIKVDKTHKYVVTEEIGWSWKYAPGASTVSPTGDGNFVSGTSVTVNGNYSAGPVTVLIEGSPSVSNYARASFTDSKATQEQNIRNVEGDVSVANNVVSKSIGSTNGG